MGNPNRRKLEAHEVEAFCATSGWKAADGVLSKELAFSSYPDGVAFAVAIAMTAERRDHHPDLFIGWGKVGVRWSTHDAGGITPLDLELAKLSDELAVRHGSKA
ncbi:MAG: 4a-hydroxytetrahydrobiopterin dehydratase [Polyangiaceae bacterium]|nr:4a-hydroxytetrahydrobiopterin dehydratase [Polyangiaceae bacterium]